MQETWIPLQCPETWEATLSDLPEPDEEFTCKHCAAQHPSAEFTETIRGLEMLRDFHS